MGGMVEWKAREMAHAAVIATPEAESSFSMGKQPQERVSITLHVCKLSLRPFKIE